MNQAAAQNTSDFTCFYNYVRKNIFLKGVITKQYREIPKLNHHNIALAEILKDLALKYKEKDHLKTFFLKLKALTILNQNKRDGGLFNFF